MYSVASQYFLNNEIILLSFFYHQHLGLHMLAPLHGVLVLSYNYFSFEGNHLLIAIHVSSIICIKFRNINSLFCSIYIINKLICLKHPILSKFFHAICVPSFTIKNKHLSSRPSIHNYLTWGKFRQGEVEKFKEKEQCASSKWINRFSQEMTMHSNIRIYLHLESKQGIKLYRKLFNWIHAAFTLR